MKTVPQIRVFLASPGDVNEERAVALEVLDMLEYDPLFKRNGTGGVSIHAIAWDKPGGDTPMRATMTPQTAIKQGLPRPSQCDIVLVLFWGRMGTELPFPEYQKPDGSKFLSGTEWEFTDAVTAEREHGRPITLIYRRTEEPRIDMKDRKQVAQYHGVLNLFDQFRDPSTGALLGGVNEYKTPEDLRQKLINHLRMIIDSILSDEGFTDSGAASSDPAARPLVEAPPLWTGSPFPGLRAFTQSDTPIFFGRGLETSELVKRVEASRFTAIVAASGSGKSSLVAAGLIPRLKANAIVSGETGSKDWRFVRFTPGHAESPFAALFGALCEAFPEHAVSPFLIEQEKEGFVASIAKNPAALVSICDALLREAKAPVWTEILFVVDQFEELFTLVRESESTQFVALLEAIYMSRRLRCIVTMRSDFTAQAIENPVLANLINQGNYMLAVPTAGALIEMIKRPAERAGLTWDDGLPERIQAETGSDAGALALMAYALDELYQTSHANKRLTFSAYQAIGGVEGAIGKRAETAVECLTLPDKDRLLQRMFRELVTVDERGTATRQRATLTQFGADERALIRVLADARLLVTQDDSVEVAHEAVFRSWIWLKNWIDEAQEDLILLRIDVLSEKLRELNPERADDQENLVLLRQVRAAANEWARKGRPDFLRWPAERLKPVYEIIERQQPTLNDTERDFIEPEQTRLLSELDKRETTHEHRRDIGDRLALIGDPRPGIGVKDGLPEIVWLPILQGGEITIEKQKFNVDPFYIAQYLITFVQYQAFVEAEDGFDNPEWWIGMPKEYQQQELANQRTKTPNNPRDSVSWYQSVAFARWMDRQLKRLELPHPARKGILRVGSDAEVRLPTEWEWQWAAQNGTELREYPWGQLKEGYANTSEAGLGRAIAVGMYPQVAASCGALDMTGNIWEWCLNDVEPIEQMSVRNKKYKALRGGSFGAKLSLAACASRFIPNSNFMPSHHAFGLRLVVSSLMRL